MPKTDLQSKLDRGDEVPDDVPHWIVEMHTEFDQRHLTPLQAVHMAVNDIRKGHCWTVTHIRSGLRFSVNLGTGSVIEVVEVELKRK
jgi:hypothetical protein